MNGRPCMSNDTRKFCLNSLQNTWAGSFFMNDVDISCLNAFITPYSSKMDVTLSPPLPTVTHQLHIQHSSHSSCDFTQAPTVQQVS
jgi:hypothetical protein